MNREYLNEIYGIHLYFFELPRTNFRKDYFIPPDKTQDGFVYWLLAYGKWLMVIGHWFTGLLVIGYWTLDIGQNFKYQIANFI